MENKTINYMKSFGIKKRWTLAALYLLLSLFSTDFLHAQVPEGYTSSAIGNDFWFCYMQNVPESDATGPELDQPSSGQTLRVMITAIDSVKGRISLPLRAWSLDFEIAAGSTQILDVPVDLAYTVKSDSIQPTGVHVRTDGKVTVAALNHQGFSGDAAGILPTDALRNRYIVISYQENPTYFGGGYVPPAPFWYSEMAIVAHHDNTRLKITPSTTTRDGQLKGVAFEVNLQAGEVYQLQAAEDLTGTLVESSAGNDCQTFAIFGGNVCTSVGDCASCDHLFEQIIPVENWGDFFILTGLKGKTNDRFRFIAAEDNTTVTLLQAGSNTVTKTLNQGEFWEQNLISINRNLAHVVTSDKHIAAIMYAKGIKCDPSNTYDPLMLQVPPILDSMPVKKMIVNAFDLSDNVRWSHHVNIITREEAKNQITIMPAPASPLTWRNVPEAPEYVWANALFSEQGNYIIESGHPKYGFHSIVYGSQRYESYGYTGQTVFATEPILMPYSMDLAWTPEAETLVTKPYTVDFTNTTLEKERYSYQWFINGETACSGENCSYTFPDTGRFQVTLQATHPVSGCFMEKTYTLRVKDPDIVGREKSIAGVKLTGFYPNPTKGTINLTWPAGESGKWRLADLTGRILLEGALETGKIRQPIEIGHLTNGTYFLTFQLASGKTEHHQVLQLR